MRIRLSVLVVICAVPALCGQNSHPLTHTEACAKFSKAIVGVNTDHMNGTGFIVGPDGWIITAFHVIADKNTLKEYGHITVSIEGIAASIPAQVLSPINSLNAVRDFAILKIDKTGLDSLNLGNEDDVAAGSDIVVIGFPLTAMFPYQMSSIPKFCLFGTIAAQASLPIGQRQYLDTVYFQGVSVKGISGAPIISLDTGKVIAIADTKLTGIGANLEQLSDDIATGKVGGGISMSGFTAMDLKKVIDLLDTQLANGLGSGTGAADAAYALNKAKRDYVRQHPIK